MHALSGQSPFHDCSHGGQVAIDSEVEPSLAVDPADPHRLLAAWQQDRNASGGALGLVTAASADGGATWRTSIPPHLFKCAAGPYALASDPVVSIGAGGRAFLGAVAVKVTGSGENAEFDTDIAASASVDGGVSWGDPVIVASSDDPRVSFDKETLVADPRTEGTAYAVWVRYTQQDPNQPARTNETLFSRTTDGGTSWSTPVSIHSGETETQFHQLVELPEGSLVDVFIEAPSLSDKPPLAARLAAIRSEDGGVTWSPSATVADITFTVPTDPTRRDGVRGTGQGILAAAAPDGSVYVVWAEERLQGGSFVAVVRSDDSGVTWSAPVKMATDRNQPFIPGIAVAADGTVGVGWYELQPIAPTGTRAPLFADVRLAWSVDRSATWSELHVAGPFDMHMAKLSVVGDFVGDYFGLAALPGGFGVAYAVAAPLASVGATDVFFSRVELSAAGG